MKEVMDAILDSWFTLLSGQLNYDSREVKVYPEDADNSDTFHHVEIRAESETDSSNKTTFVTNPVVIIEVVTFHPVSVNKSVSNNIVNQIKMLVFPTRKCALPALNGLQISGTDIQSSYLKEDDGTKKIYRTILRVKHRINQVTI